jgi:DNA polymerase IV
MGAPTGRVRAEPSILHADLDAFFASVEQRRDPSLVGQPVVVGGTGGRGVVAAASYEARRYGIHSAMPTARARRLCPHAVFLPPRFDDYTRTSAEVFEIFGSFTPLVEGLSVDEAFLDVAGVRRVHGDPRTIAEAIRRRVRDDTGLAISVGAATTKLLAKLASDIAKPDGLLVVEAGGELGFLHPLPVGRLWGVGPATRARLDRFGVRTIGDLAAVPEATLVGALGEAQGRHLHALANGRDDRPVEPDRDVKSIGAEETFAVDLWSLADVERELLRLAERVGTRLRAAGWAARTITVKVRFPDFTTPTRSRTLDDPTDATAALLRVATELTRGVVDARPDGTLPVPVRLLGVSGGGLTRDVAVQGALDLGLGGDGGGTGRPERSTDRAVDRVVDAVRERFGDDAVLPASLVGRASPRTRFGPSPEPVDPPPAR